MKNLRHMLFLGLFSLCFWGISTAVFAHTLQGILLQKKGENTDIFLKVSPQCQRKIFFLSHPDRLVIDLTDTRLQFTPKPALFNNAMVSKLRIGHPNAHTLRLVFELKRPLRLSMQPKPTPQGYHLQLTAKKGVKLIPLTQTIIKPPQSLRDVVVVIDAGHGGKDPGAKGPRRSQEKDVVLAIALKLKQLIDKQPGMRAVMTRKGDYYVGLRQRLQMARRFNGDIFVSIHADAFIHQHSHGASVFALSQRGATSEAARWIAEKENYSELGGVNLSDLDDTNGMVRSVLIDLSQTATIRSSLQMGDSVLHSIGHISSLHNNHVEQARFMVLKSPDIPSILIETGFISNPHEESNLKNPQYQNRLSQAIFRGIKTYFWQYPPHGTRLAQMVQGPRSKPKVS